MQEFHVPPLYLALSRTDFRKFERERLKQREKRKEEREIAWKSKRKREKFSRSQVVTDFGRRKEKGRGLRNWPHTHQPRLALVQFSFEWCSNSRPLSLSSIFPRYFSAFCFSHRLARILSLTVCALRLLSFFFFLSPQSPRLLCTLFTTDRSLIFLPLCLIAAGVVTILWSL